MALKKYFDTRKEADKVRDELNGPYYREYKTVRIIKGRNKDKFWVCGYYDWLNSDNITKRGW